MRKDRIKQIKCPKVFREKVKSHLSKQNENGIPQGTTISDVIANMYMIDFDILMKKFATKYGGYYKRYSDDILYICKLENQEKAMRFILNTEIFSFCIRGSFYLDNNLITFTFRYSCF